MTTADRPRSLTQAALAVFREHQRVTPASRECSCGEWQPFSRPFAEHLVDELRRAGIGFAGIRAIAPRLTYAVHEISVDGRDAYEVVVRRGRDVIDRRVISGAFLFRRLRRRTQLVEATYGATREVAR